MYVLIHIQNVVSWYLSYAYEKIRDLNIIFDSKYATHLHAADLMVLFCYNIFFAHIIRHAFVARKYYDVIAS